MRFTFLITLTWFVFSCQDSKPSFSDSWPLLGFDKQDDINPILVPDDGSTFHCPINDSLVRWESRNVLNPTALVKDGNVILIYRAQDQNMVSRLGMAISEDGLSFTRQPNPVFFPVNDSTSISEWPGGVEDPRIVVSEEGEYILTYTAYDGKMARLFVASSVDLKNWERHGPVLGTGKYKDTWSKAGAIVSKLEGNRIIASKVQGKYWMYFGDTNLYMAISDDLKSWQVLEDTQLNKMISVLHPRRGYFDSRLVEPGPYALIRDEGILLIYNSMNAKEYNDPALPVGTYSAGQALFDRNKPYQLIDRLSDHFIHPNKEYERLGEVNEVCFVEGLVNFRDKWYLYYGTADSNIAVAVSDQL